MIIVEYNPKNLGLKVTGHAGKAKKGEDIVCAAASMVVMMFLNALAIYDVPHQSVTDEGFAEIQIDDSTYKSRLLFNYTVSGLALLADHEKKHVKVRKNEELFEHN